jgi:hypothetical protein
MMNDIDWPYIIILLAVAAFTGWAVSFGLYGVAVGIMFFFWMVKE